jgi:hypothetical protein
MATVQKDNKNDNIQEKWNLLFVIDNKGVLPTAPIVSIIIMMKR